MSARPSASHAKLRRDLLAKPGFTRLPVCPHCRQEVDLLRYSEHTRECEKAVKQPPAKKQEAVNGANGAHPAPRGLVYALFDPKAVARLERAGAEILRLRQELRDQHDAFTPTDRVERCREIARRECLSMALVLDQLRHRFAIQGTGMVFLRNLRPHVVDDGLRQSCVELTRMADPAVWRTA
jgi:hypothetical protein